MIVELNRVFLVENIHDFHGYMGIFKEEIHDFCLNGAFLMGKCVITWLRGGFLKRICFILV